MNAGSFRHPLRFLPLVGLGLAMLLRVAGAPQMVSMGAFVLFGFMLPIGYRRLRRTDGGADLLDRFEPSRSAHESRAAADARIADVVADLERNADLDRR